jgi:hypothetical protein
MNTRHPVRFIRSRACLLGMLMAAALGASASQPAEDAGTAGASTAPGQAAPADLSFRDFFRLPVGPKGLEPTEKLLSLNHKTVRLQGYLVDEEEPLPGLALMTPVPTALAELADGPADYLPPATLYIHLQSKHAKKFVTHRPGLWTAVGRLELGGKHEPNGRVSYVRLIVEDPAALRDPTNRVAELAATAPMRHQHGH